MQIYSPTEITKKVEGLTVRQITDLAEKGIVAPVKETSGAGYARLYDTRGILQMLICVSVRGFFPNDKLPELLEQIDFLTRRENSPIKYLVIKRRGEGELWLHPWEDRQKLGKLEGLIDIDLIESVPNVACSVVINLEYLREFVTNNFGELK